ncbi:MAG: ATP-binding domain-containing protein [Candidatus Marinimicrobia bacterium]|jgi:hypothetical protein|nr:ATP-binding domain-containing protein [Candidatus Neomarinimicrobiota bacterium]
MATMIPNLNAEQLSKIDSYAEAKVYQSLKENLSSDYIIFFQVSWILKREEQQARDGETDFVICHPKKGFICVEVKGGGIGFDSLSDEWYSIDRKNHKNIIKNPVGQSLRAKYSILNKLYENPSWKRLNVHNVIRGHTVFFPDILNASKIARNDMPSILIGTSSDLDKIGDWTDRVFEYWHNDDSSQSPIGQSGIDIMRMTFAKSFEVKPLVSIQLQEQEQQRIQLTNDQVRILDFLQSQRRAAVRGGAGTGKTVLAVEKAKRLAIEGFKTLLTCYNRQLADHIKNVCMGIENLDVMSFHQLCHKRITKAAKVTDRDLLKEAELTYPGTDLFDIQYPAALSFSLDIISEQYDAIVCDEGQDFRDEYWLPLELLLADYDTSPFYIFFDDNQNIYSRVKSFPSIGEPYSLVSNCRNTNQIHMAAYHFYHGIDVAPPGINGDEIKFIEANGIAQQAKKLHGKILDLIVNQNIQAKDIVILVFDAVMKNEYYNSLKKQILPKPNTWSEEGIQSECTVLMDTVNRFKGLESSVIFLWGMDSVDLDKYQSLLYVGLSRAKSIVYFVGTNRICDSFREKIINS